eukprot:8413509-Pyramimonas_sp.AAC.1
MRLDAKPGLLRAGVADVSPMHGRCIADVSAVRRGFPTPSTPIPSWRPLRIEGIILGAQPDLGQFNILHEHETLSQPEHPKPQD